MKRFLTPFLAAMAGGLLVAMLARPPASPVLPPVAPVVQPSEPPDAILAQRIILRQPDGKPRVIISAGSGQGPTIMLLNIVGKPALTLAVTKSADPALQLTNKSGGVTIGAEAGGQSIMSFSDREGHERIRARIDATDKIPSVEILEPDGRLRFKAPSKAADKAVDEGKAG